MYMYMCMYILAVIHVHACTLYIKYCTSMQTSRNLGKANSSLERRSWDPQSLRVYIHVHVTVVTAFNSLDKKHPYHCPSVVHPSTGSLKVFLQVLVALEGQVIVLNEKGHVCQLTKLELYRTVRIAGTVRTAQHLNNMNRHTDGV